MEFGTRLKKLLNMSDYSVTYCKYSFLQSDFVYVPVKRVAYLASKIAEYEGTKNINNLILYVFCVCF